MKFILASLLFLYSMNAFAGSCWEIAKYDDMNSAIYVVCPDLPKIANEQADEIVSKIFNSREFVPDEYQIFFVGALSQITNETYKSKALLGLYYTHDNRLTIWPNIPEKSKSIELKNN